MYCQGPLPTQPEINFSGSGGATTVYGGGSEWTPTGWSIIICSSNNNNNHPENNSTAPLPNNLPEPIIMNLIFISYN